MHRVLFLLHPFLMLLLSLKNFRLPYAKNIMWAFTVFFAMTIAVGHESKNSDINRYMAQVEELHSEKMDISSAITYFEKSGEVDVIRTLLAIIVSRFTANGYYLLPIYGLIFGFFFSRNMWFVLNRLKGKLQWVVVLLITVMFLVMPIWSLGGFRYNTATHVFLYGLLPFLYSGTKKSLVWCFITPVVFHFAFVLPAVVVLLYLIVGQRLTLYFAFFISTLFISEINITQFNSYIDNYAPERLAERSEGYRSATAVLNYRQAATSSNSWHARYYQKALRWSLIAFLLILFFRSKQVLLTNPMLLRILSFTYLFFGVGLLMSSIPSGGRYLSPASILAAAVLAVYIQNNKQEKWMKRAISVSIPLLLLFIIVEFRKGFYFASITTVLGNPLIAIYTFGENIPLNELIK